MLTHVELYSERDAQKESIMEKFRISLISGLLLSVPSGFAMSFEGNIDLLSKQFMKTSFHGSCLRGTSLIAQNLSEVDFRDADISGANLIGTILTNAKMNSNTKFSGATGWVGTIKIEPGKQKPGLHALSGEEISVTKEWLMGQGVIFEE